MTYELVKQLKNYIEQPFYEVLSSSHFCKKRFRSIPLTELVSGRGRIRLLLGEQDREDGLIKSWPFFVFQYYRQNNRLDG